MPQYKQFPLPDTAEGLTEAEILTWHVKPGDTVKVNQIIVEIETAKSAVELPSPYEGVVAELHAPEGQMVDVGAPIITIDVAPDGAPESTAPPIAAAGSERLAGDDLIPPIPADEAASEPGIEGGPAPGGRTPVLVGYGPRTTEAKRRPRKSEGASEVAQARSTAAADSKAPVMPTATAPAAGAPAVSTQADRTGPVLAKPPVRKLAKDLGVDLRVLKPTGPSGTVTRPMTAAWRR